MSTFVIIGENEAVGLDLPLVLGGSQKTIFRSGMFLLLWHCREACLDIILTMEHGTRKQDFAIGVVGVEEGEAGLSETQETRAGLGQLGGNECVEQQGMLMPRTRT
jgi:hypothetical protein